MLRILVLFFFLSGCGWSNADKGAPQESSIPAPSPGDADVHGRVVYPEPPAPPGTQEPNDLGLPDMGEDDTPSKYCSYMRVEVETDAEDIERSNVQGIYKTVDFEEDDVDVPKALAHADHIHLVEARVVSTSEHKLNFLSWIKIWARTPDGEIKIAWAKELYFAGTEVQLEVNGGADLVPATKPTFSLRGEARAQSPDEDLSIKGLLSFDMYYNCVWY